MRKNLTLTRKINFTEPRSSTGGKGFLLKLLTYHSRTFEDLHRWIGLGFEAVSPASVGTGRFPGNEIMLAGEAVRMFGGRLSTCALIHFRVLL